MKISVDIDGVLAEVIDPILERINKEYELNLVKSDITSWSPKIKDTDLGKIIRLRLCDQDFVTNIPVIKDAQKSLEILSQKHDIIITTCRPQCAYNSTMIWLLKNDFVYNEVVFCKNKSNEILKTDVLIDDYPGYIKTYLDGKSQAILFSRPWSVIDILNPVDPVGSIYIASRWEKVLRGIEILEEFETFGAYKRSLR